MTRQGYVKSVLKDAKNAPVIVNVSNVTKTIISIKICAINSAQMVILKLFLKLK